MPNTTAPALDPDRSSRGLHLRRSIQSAFAPVVTVLTAAALTASPIALVACGRLAPKTFDVEARRAPLMISSGERPATVDAFAAGSLAFAVDRSADVALVMNTVALQEAAARRSPPAPSSPSTPNSGPSTLGEAVPCGGDLPPCWRVQIESHGTWNAYNPTGCSGTGCFGPYQFGGFWAGKLGLPSDLTQTTHEEWVNAARQLWNGGAGCGNWDACG